MAFLGEDDDAVRAFEAVLRFVDDFPIDEKASEDSADNVATTVQRSAGDGAEIPSLDNLAPVANEFERDHAAGPGTGGTASYPQENKVVTKPRSATDKVVTKPRSATEAARARRRAADNARKKMLRKAGVYANPNRARNERKLEIAYLREKVGQLEAELVTLQGPQHQAVTGVDEDSKQDGGVLVKRTGAFGDEQSSQTNVASVWSGVASRQKNRREKAERENVRLKLILEGQIKVAKSLESLLIKRAQQQIAEYASVRAPGDIAPSGRTMDYRTDAEDFQELLEHLDTAYRNVDAVLAANGLATMEITQQDVFMREGVDGMHMELFSNKVMPFAHRATAEATWNYMKGSEKHRGKLYAKATQNLDTPYTIIEHFSKELAAGNSRTDVRIKQVVRRYVEAEREVVVWVATVTSIEITRKPFAGLSSHHRNYAVIKRAKSSTPEQELSLLQLVAHVKLDTKEGTLYDSKYLRALTDFLLSNAANNIKADQELIESVILDQTLHSQQK